jgi:hypothetical protein
VKNEDIAPVVTLFIIISLFVGGIVGFALMPSGHEVLATVLTSIYVALWTIPLVTTPIVCAILDKLEEGRALKRDIRRAESKAKVEEINLRHALEMDRIRLEHGRIQHELREVLAEDGVPPAPRAQGR